MSDPPLPPPFGLPSGPSLPTAELLGSYLDGAEAGSSPDAHVEGPVLMAGLHPVALRLAGALLVRQADLSEGPAGVRRTLLEALRERGIELIEEDPPLAFVVEIELVGRRGHVWDLWAADAAEAQRALAEQVVDETLDAPALLDTADARRRAEAEIDATLTEIERDL